MREITNLMVKHYGIMRIGYDFMGYKVDNEKSLSFHHLIVPHRDCKRQNIPSDGYVWWNGAILRQNTSHNYLHLIERVNYDMFCDLTSEMVDENIKGRLDIENLRHIDDILTNFERENCGKSDRNGKCLIKKIYTERNHF